MYLSVYLSVSGCTRTEPEPHEPNRIRTEPPTNRNRPKAIRGRTDHEPNWNRNANRLQSNHTHVHLLQSISRHKPLQTPAGFYKPHRPQQNTSAQYIPLAEKVDLAKSRSAKWEECEAPPRSPYFLRSPSLPLFPSLPLVPSWSFLQNVVDVAHKT